MASTGNLFPGTGENIDRGGLTDWVSPGNIVSDNATDATVVGGASGSDYLVARNFNFSAVPANATITGITVRVEASEHSTSTESLSARLQDASATLVGSTKANTISGTGKAVYTYGGSADTWTASPTAAMIHDPDFGVRLWFTTAHDIRIDYVTMALEYTVPSVGRADETDTALALVGKKIGAVGMATETDTAFALELAGGTLQIPVGRADETDTALVLVGKKIGTYLPAVEIDTALALAGKKIGVVGMAEEIDSAFALALYVTGGGGPPYDRHRGRRRGRGAMKGTLRARKR